MMSAQPIPTKDENEEKNEDEPGEVEVEFDYGLTSHKFFSFTRYTYLGLGVAGVTNSVLLCVSAMLIMDICGDAEKAELLPKRYLCREDVGFRHLGVLFSHYTVIGIALSLCLGMLFSLGPSLAEFIVPMKVPISSSNL